MNTATQTTGYALHNRDNRPAITTPKSYAACAQLAQTRKRKLANNTYLEARGENFAIRLHSTDIVTFRPDGAIILNSGGWRTVTTKARMNEFQNVTRISQEKGIWYCGKKVFADGITFHADGSITGTSPTPAADLEKRGRQISRYVSGYLKALSASKVPAPSAGDCWFCALVDTNGQAWGESNHDVSHLAEHMKERYYVPSLLNRAMARFPVPDAARYFLSDKWAGTDNGKFWADVAPRYLANSLRRYLRQQFNLGG